MKKLAFSIQLTVGLTPTVGKKKKNEGQREILFLRGGRREKGREHSYSGWEMQPQ